ncbi:MAG TPA: hypothetical protein VJA21_27710, partial [Verrucomicrobiae bacterium]
VSPCLSCCLVSRLARILALLLLTFWGLATVHCRLEEMPGFGFLACCHHTGSTPHQDDDCSRDGCATVESGFYKLEEQPVAAVQLLVPVSFLPPLAQSDPISDLVRSPTARSVSSELPHTWQFLLRTALPPRAPSMAS